MLINTEKIMDFWKIRGVPEWPGCDRREQPTVGVGG